DELRLALRAGERIRLAELAATLEEMGFERSATVEEVGQFALRGGIVDVFGFGAPEPARIEFLGDEIESIRFFDILTQLSVRAVDALELLPVDLRPAREGGGAPSHNAAQDGGGAAERRSLLDYLPPETVVVHLDGAAT